MVDYFYLQIRYVLVVNISNQDRMQMLDTVKQSLLLVDVRERYVLAILTALRALLGLFDIAGLFLVGLLLAIEQCQNQFS